MLVKDAEKLGYLYIAYGNIKWNSPSEEYCSLKKNNNNKLATTYESAIPLLAFYLREMKIYGHILFIIAPNWRQPETLLVGE